MMKRTTFTVLLITSFLGFSYTSIAQETHADDHTHHTLDSASLDHNQDNGPMPSDQIDKLAKLVTGQGEFIFSFDQLLTGAFPKDAHEFEPKMHGGFNEDPETGIVYTGIPGYGLCSISQDLTKWNVN